MSNISVFILNDGRHVKLIQNDAGQLTKIVRNAEGRIVKVTVAGNETEYVYNDAGECIGYYDDEGNPVIVNEDMEEPDDVFETENKSQPGEHDADESEHYESGTDQQFGRYDVEVMNGDGYYDEDGKFHWFSKN